METKDELEQRHAATSVQDPFAPDEWIQIDNKILPLLKLLWKEKIETCNSCEDNMDGKAWIMLNDIDDWRKIIQRAHAYKMQECERESDQNIYTLKDFIDEKVNCTIVHSDDGTWITNDGEDEYVPGNQISLSCSIRFPKEDIKIFQRLWKKTFSSSGYCTCKKES